MPRRENKVTSEGFRDRKKMEGTPSPLPRIPETLMFALSYVCVCQQCNACVRILNLKRFSF